MPRTWLVVFALILSVLPIATPARAAGATPPTLAALTSVRENSVLLFNDRPLQVCQRSWQSWNRVHGTCRDLATASVYGQRLIAGTTVEFVLFDGTRYQRVNDATTWTSEPDPDFAPDLPLTEALFGISEPAQVSRVGTVDVAGASTTQYQYWVTNAASNAAVGGQLVYDQFISSEGLVRKQHTSVRGSIPGLGDGTLVSIYTFSDFNTPVVITPPTT